MICFMEIKSTILMNDFKAYFIQVRINGSGQFCHKGHKGNTTQSAQRFLFVTSVKHLMFAACPDKGGVAKYFSKLITTCCASKQHNNKKGRLISYSKQQRVYEESIKPGRLPFPFPLYGNCSSSKHG